MSDINSTVRLEAHIPRERVAALAKEAHASGQNITDFLRREIARVFNVSEDSITPIILEPRPNIVTDAAADYARLCRTPRQGDSFELPVIPGTFTVRVH